MLTKKLLAIAVAASLSSSAGAAVFHFTGNITYSTDVVTIPFSLDANATDVRVWTDSFLSGVNFDPITALWNASTGARIGQNDDNDDVNPSTQTYYDSGFTLPTLNAGNYFFTIATYPNFAAGNNISDGFQYETTEPLSTWCQPSSHCGMGTFWSVWLDGVSSATDPNAVPEPTAIALAGLGLLGLGLSRRSTKAKQA